MALTPTPFSPVVDGEVLPQAPWPALAAGAGRNVELLAGHTRDEYRLLAARAASQITDAQATATLERLAPGPDGDDAYRAAYPDVSPAQLHELINADWLFRMPSWHLAVAQHTGGGAAWTSELCWSYNAAGASHTLDVLLVFGTLDIDDVHRQAGPDVADEAVRLSDHMHTDWVNFAAGNPGWPAYDPTPDPPASTTPNRRISVS